MRALKLLVIVLGVLLAAGVAGLAAAVVWRVNHAPLPAAGTAPAVNRITLPADAKIVGAEVSAGRLVARADLPGGGTRLYIFDLATGASIATIELAPSPK